MMHSNNSIELKPSALFRYKILLRCALFIGKLGVLAFNEKGSEYSIILEYFISILHRDNEFCIYLIVDTVLIFPLVLKCFISLYFKFNIINMNVGEIILL